MNNKSDEPRTMPVEASLEKLAGNALLRFGRVTKVAV
jgi:hypothetical protein